MAAYLVTHSLLSSWLHLIRENPYEDLTTEGDPLAEFMLVLRREPTPLLNLPWRLSKEQISWLKNRMKDKRPEVRALAKEQYEMRFPPKRLEDIEDDFIE